VLGLQLYRPHGPPLRLPPHPRREAGSRPQLHSQEPDLLDAVRHLRDRVRRGIATGKRSSDFYIEFNVLYNPFLIDCIMFLKVTKRRPIPPHLRLFLLSA
jgi:hypothetical protein